MSERRCASCLKALEERGLLTQHGYVHEECGKRAIRKIEEAGA